ncbi:MAG: Holliday junction resolvase RuvX [Actinomycetota bacterium]
MSDSAWPLTSGSLRERRDRGRAQGILRPARALADALAARVDIPVRLVDERLTTAAADRALIGLGHRAPRRRRLVDASAAALLLQSFLDSPQARS